MPDWGSFQASSLSGLHCIRLVVISGLFLTQTYLGGKAHLSRAHSHMVFAVLDKVLTFN